MKGQKICRTRAAENLDEDAEIEIYMERKGEDSDFVDDESESDSDESMQQKLLVIRRFFFERYDALVCVSRHYL